MEHCYKTFISVGNAKQHFSRLLTSIDALADILPHPILVQSGHTPFKSSVCDVVDFIAMDDFTQYVSQAEILILHAGAGSLLHAMKAQKYPIVVPRKAQFNEHVNDHQVAFANMLQTEGKAMMVEDTSKLREAICAIKQRKQTTSHISLPSRASEVINNLLVELFNQPAGKTS